MKHLHSIFKVLFLGIILTGFTANSLKACKIEFEVEGEKKEVYKEGDIAVVKVKVTFTHRICPLSIKETKFDSKGIQIIGATDWEETSPGVWQRKLQAKITGSKNGKLTITGSRTCDKIGGYGSITLQGESS